MDAQKQIFTDREIEVIQLVLRNLHNGYSNQRRKSYGEKMIPFNKSWIINGSNFTPDGKWIFVRDPLPRKGEDIPNFWIHPVESSDDDASIELSKGMDFLGFSDKSNKIVFVGNGRLQILSFPDGQVISQWDTTGYSVDRAWWSPDGGHLALQGFSRNGQSEAIFLIQP